MSGPSYYDQVQQTASVLRTRWGRVPDVAVVLGSGLGDFADGLQDAAVLPYGEIPNWPESRVVGHQGKLSMGTASGKFVAALSGRVHYYEGYELRTVTFPVRVLAALGIKVLILTNAAGGINTRFAAGDLMAIDDHINLMGDNPLIGINDDRLGPRFPDMCQPYDPELIEVGLAVARRENFAAHRGVTVAVTGPNLETRAEYRFLRAIGADVVGMSTVPEVIVGVHAGMRNVGFSIITDMCLPDALEPVKLEEIIATASAAIAGPVLPSERTTPRAATRPRAPATRVSSGRTTAVRAKAPSGVRSASPAITMNKEAKPSASPSLGRRRSRPPVAAISAPMAAALGASLRARDSCTDRSIATRGSADAASRAAGSAARSVAPTPRAAALARRSGSVRTPSTDTTK